MELDGGTDAVHPHLARRKKKSPEHLAHVHGNHLTTTNLRFLYKAEPVTMCGMCEHRLKSQGVFLKSSLTCLSLALVALSLNASPDAKLTLKVCESSSEGRTTPPAKCCTPRDFPRPWAKDEDDDDEDSFSPSPSLLGRKYSRVPDCGSRANHLGCHPLTTLVNLLSCPANGMLREELLLLMLPPLLPPLLLLLLAASPSPSTGEAEDELAASADIADNLQWSSEDDETPVGGGVGSRARDM